MLRDVALDPDGDTSAVAVHMVEDVMIADNLRIRFATKEGQPLISGVEIISVDKGR